MSNGVQTVPTKVQGDEPVHDAAQTITADTLKVRLRELGEIAVLDVREQGEFADGHLFFAVSVPYSRFEPELVRLVPRLGTPVVLIDDGRSGRAWRAAARAQELGYGNVFILFGGTAGWREAGFELFEGVHVPSKTFGEIVDYACHVPSVTANELAEWRQRGDEVLVLDGRPLDEHEKMNIPGSTCLPNGDLPYRIDLLLEDDKMPIVVHCAGRTRSIIGAQTLRHLGIRNPIFALENGTQGWALAGLGLEHGSHRCVTATPDEAGRDALRQCARGLAARFDVPFATPDEVRSWLADDSRTTYLLDVRSPAEISRCHAPGAVSAPGGQLVLATDLWLGTRGARVVLVDDDAEIRAVTTAGWLSQMGWDAFALAGGEESWSALPPARHRERLHHEPVARVSTAKLCEMRRGQLPMHIIDLRPSLKFRKNHLVGAIWSTRFRVADVVGEPTEEYHIVLVDDEDISAALVARDLRGLGFTDIVQLDADSTVWEQKGLAVESTPDMPCDQDCVDFVFFTHDRHSGNSDAARRYLAWETGLVGRIDADERMLLRPWPE